MATKLKKMKLTSVDLVRAGANQEADICLFKSADPPEATENPTEPDTEPHSHIEKGEETPDLELIYKSALAESLHSIMQDDTLTDIEKKDMSETSLTQYAEKIRGGDNIDEAAVEAVDDFDKDDYYDDDEYYEDDEEDTIEEEIVEEVRERRHERPRHRRRDIDIDEIEEVVLSKE